MNCFQWLFSSGTTEIIRPSKSNDGKRLLVPKGEQMFGLMPLCFATYPAIALRVPKCDEKRLKQSLSKALDLVPSAAGRYGENGDILELNDAGVPFTVVQSQEASAPEKIEEPKLLNFATFHRPWSVRNGYSPLISIKLTSYKDGSGVLAFSRSHMLFDGSSAWIFLGIWASFAKSDTVKEPSWRKEEVVKLLPDDKEFQEMAQKMFGINPKPTILTKLMKNFLIPVVGAVMDTFFLYAGYSLTRYRFFFSDEELALLKDEATPKEVAAGQDNWVTTQEALCAFMLLALGRNCLPKTCSGSVAMIFLLDVRKALKLSPNQLMGNGLTFCSLSIESQKLLAMDLPGLASHLHQMLSTGEGPGSLESQRDLWRVTNGACEREVQNNILQKIHRPDNCDLKFAVNNSSKRILPDYGIGRCDSVVTNAGPTVFLPAQGGIEVHLDPSVFSSAGCSQSQRQNALDALRQLPKKKTE
ncbi:Anthranilate N-benzoyltransferase protein 2 [Durusdinium trenchii]|uniref:Anthranilate N-benzoyltransferase protein 2 n=1 Tax=Durusdinium trenchii TaxID=1381693 RepID=A0ABP0IMG9_9DINO